jgi:hypothetical protein
MGFSTFSLHPEIYGANTSPIAAEDVFLRKDLLEADCIISFFIIDKLGLKIELIIYRNLLSKKTKYSE